MDIRITNPLCYTAQGNKPNQEDTLYPLEGKATRDSRVFMVCDGMGGHENGEVASACVAETIGRQTSALPVCRIDDMKVAFEKALGQAYLNLDALDTCGSGKKMGTTLTFLALCSDGVLTAHIGDSRIYQFRQGKGIVFQTRDHSLVNELITAGELTEAEAKTFPQRNVITRAVQPHQEYPARPAYNVLTDIRRGDIFMLCCDGVVEQLDNDDLTSIILSRRPLRDKLMRLKEECHSRGTKDNNTCYLLEIGDVNGACNDTTREQETKHRYGLWIAALLLAFMAILLLALFSAKGNGSHADSATADDSPAKVEKAAETVQGTIKRNHD